MASGRPGGAGTIYFIDKIEGPKSILRIDAKGRSPRAGFEAPMSDQFKGALERVFNCELTLSQLVLPL